MYLKIIIVQKFRQLDETSNNLDEKSTKLPFRVINDIIVKIAKKKKKLRLAAVKFDIEATSFFLTHVQLPC